MASPVADSYSAASGVTLCGGRAPPAGWAASLVNDTMTVVGNGTILAWMTANVPPGNYLGTGPYSAIVDAYCDPSYDAATGKMYYFGGGHGDSTCNAVIAQDLAAQSFSIVGLPTPPSKYPPRYVYDPATGLRALVYPSGAADGAFFMDSLTDPLDVQYNTTYARASSHMYAAACYTQGKIYYFYGSYAEFDLTTGNWVKTNGFSYGPQIKAIGDATPGYNKPNYNSVDLQAGTYTIYDDVTDRFYSSFVPGDNGGGWRAGLIAMTRDRIVEGIYGSQIVQQYATVLVPVGRNIYYFSNKPDGTTNDGTIFNMDTKVSKYFRIVGAQEGSQFSTSPNQECIPSWYDGRMIRRYNYGTASNMIFSVNLTPESGSGNAATDPFILRQTGRVITGAVPSSANIAYIYKRMVYHAATDSVLFIPKSNQPMLALKLS